jgi:hypothetical protein
VHNTSLLRCVSLLRKQQQYLLDALLAPVTMLTAYMCMYTSVLTAIQDWPLRWADEFTSTTLDSSKWNYGIGNACEFGVCGWGNNVSKLLQQQ